MDSPLVNEYRQRESALVEAQRRLDAAKADVDLHGRVLGSIKSVMSADEKSELDPAVPAAPAEAEVKLPKK